MRLGLLGLTPFCSKDIIEYVCNIVKYSDEIKYVRVFLQRMDFYYLRYMSTFWIAGWKSPEMKRRKANFGVRLKAAG